MRNAALSRKGESLVQSSAPGVLGSSDVAKQVGRVSGPSSGAARQDALVAQDVGAPTVGDEGNEAWVADRKAEK